MMLDKFGFDSGEYAFEKGSFGHGSSPGPRAMTGVARGR
jgi:hypothetical protein